MAFKMKGSAFKLNNVATKSALAMKSPLEQKKELSVTDKIKAGVSAVADWEGPFSDYSLSDGYKHKKKQIRKGDEISSRDTKGTGAAGKMKSPLEQTEASALKHKDGTDHEHGEGFLPKAKSEERKALKRRLVEENDGVMNDDIQAQLREFTQDYKEANPHPSMPTNKQLQSEGRVLNPGVGNVISASGEIVPDKDR